MKRTTIISLWWFTGLALVIGVAVVCRRWQPIAPGVPDQTAQRPTLSNAWTNVQAFLVRHPASDKMFAGLRPIVSNILTKEVQGHFSLYLEDLESGASLGIAETNTFNTWSILKVSVLVTVLKKVEQHQLALDQKVRVAPADQSSGTPLPGSGPAHEATVRELIEQMIKLSDNVASGALGYLFKAEEFQVGLQAMGLPRALPPEPKNCLPRVSPQQFANLLRSLYHGDYLQRPLIDLALALLADTIYDSQIKSGLPPDVTVAHKVGFNAECGNFHDCGIVFLPHRPYILCVMSSGSTREEADRIISTVSRQVYNYLAAASLDRPPASSKKVIQE